MIINTYLNDMRLLDLNGPTGDPDCSLQPLARLDRPEDEPERLRSVASTVPKMTSMNGLVHLQVEFPM